MRGEEETNRAVEEYADLLRRICLCHLNNRADTEDIFQTVWLKYLLYPGEFQDSAHERAWLIRVTINACRDYRRWRFRHETVPLELLEEEPSVEPEHREVLTAVLSLPVRYRDAVYLHYYEGYTAREIAGILKTRENTVYSLLSRGRTMLRGLLGGEENG